MKKKADNITRNMRDERSIQLEIRLLYAFLGCETLWAAIMAIALFSFGLETPALFFGTLAIVVAVISFGLKIPKLRNFIKSFYMILALVMIPVTWYYAGGKNTSANALFLIEPILFAMANKGVKQKVYIVLSILSNSLVSMLSGRFPERFGGYPMSEQQYALIGVVIGMCMTLWVAFMIIYQKNEYQHEYDRATRTSEELRRSNQMQKNFLANMSHEIRSPLGIVLGFNNLIKDSDDVAQIHEYSANIDSAGRTLHTVINDILDYSKIEAGKLDIIESDYDFNKVISDIRHDIILKCEDKGLEFVVEKADGLPAFLYGDNIRLKQCLLNLLTNAVKYTDFGRVTLNIANEVVEDEGEQKNRLTFKVIDTGRGMSEDMIPKLFTAFQRLDEGQNRGIEGTGLGLAITKSLLDEMGGTIDVSSVVGKGSVFTITLVQKNGKSDSNIDDSSLSLLDLTGIKVLVVDDTVVNLKLMDKILSKMGVIVKGVDSGKKALEECMNNRFDLILLDHMMPEMDGIETFKYLKEQKGVNEETPVIMLTANAMVGASQEYLSLGFDDYISKPVDMKELKKKVYCHARKA